jgi:hypothetical protein
MSAEQSGPAAQTQPAHADSIEEFADGHIGVRHGRVNAWLLVVYAVMFVWAIYYGFVYWGGLGPGLDY